MRIYNATNAQMNIPYPGGSVSIAPHSVSGNIGANTQTISMLVSAFKTEEIAFIVSGPFELNLCSSIPTVVNYVVQSIEEAIEKLEPKPAAKEGTVEKPAGIPDMVPVVEEVKVEETTETEEAPKVEVEVKKENREKETRGMVYRVNRKGNAKPEAEKTTEEGEALAENTLD